MIKSQQHTNWGDPEEHCAWALRSLPNISGVGQVTHPGILKRWSKHLVEAGFCHVDYLRTLADEDGNILVSQLPEQQIKFQEAFRGARHHYNNAAAWVPVDTPTPEPFRIPDIERLTIQENAALLKQYQDRGMIPALPPQRDTATELN